MIKSVKIGAFDYKVEEVTRPIIVHGRECTGAIAYEELKIELMQEYNEQRKKQTLLHEIVHGICREYGIAIPEEVEEDVVDAFATGLLQLMKDNPKLLTLINEEVVEVDGDEVVEVEFEDIVEQGTDINSILNMIRKANGEGK